MGDLIQRQNDSSGAPHRFFLKLVIQRAAMKLREHRHRVAARRSLDREQPLVAAAFLDRSTLDLAMGIEDRPPTAAELGLMRVALSEALDQGAWGMSSGLVYVLEAGTTGRVRRIARDGNVTTVSRG